MPCSIASRSWSSAAISRSSRPKVCRLSRRDRPSAASTPSARAARKEAGRPGKRPGLLAGDRGEEEAHGYLADQPAVAEERGLADRLHAEVAMLDARPYLACAERLGKRRLAVGVPDRLADQPRPHVREPDA